MLKKGFSTFSVLFKFYKNYFSKSIIIFFFSALQHAFPWFSPILIAKMIDLHALPPEGRISLFMVYSAILIAMTLWNLPASYIRAIYQSKIKRGVSRDLRIAVCRQLQNLTLLYHDKHSVGRMNSKAIRDIEVLEQIPQIIFLAIFPTTISLIIAITAISIRAPKALLFFAVLIPLSVVLRSYFNKKIKQSTQVYRQSFENMSAGFSDMMTMIPVTRAHGLEEFEMSRVKEKIQDVFKKGVRFDMITNLFGASSWVIFTMFQTLFLIGSIYFSFKGDITIGDVVMFNAFFATISASILVLIGLLPVLSQAVESSISINEILYAPDKEDNIGKRRVKRIDGKLTLKEVSYTYPDTDEKVINNLSLNIVEGKSTAFIGPSGCGKSTLLSLILGFNRPTGGEIFLDSKNMQNLDLRSFRKHVGIVTQDIVFFSGTVLFNIAYGTKGIPREKIIEVLKIANGWSFIKDLPDGLDTKMGEEGIKFSGGQKQRLAIARALLRNPKILILDEATSALDVESESLVKEALDKVMQNRTTIVISHRLSTVQNCDNIVILNKGEIVESGSHAELMRGDNFYSQIVNKSKTT